MRLWATGTRWQPSVLLARVTLATFFIQSDSFAIPLPLQNLQAIQ